jgi:hypothetical protein
LRQLEPTVTPNPVTRLFVAPSTQLRGPNAEVTVRGQPVQALIRRLISDRQLWRRHRRRLRRRGATHPSGCTQRRGRAR